MSRLIKILFFLLVSYSFLSCFCSGPQLSLQLVRDSDQIFEGILIAVDTFGNRNDGPVMSRFTFKAKKVFKGDDTETVTVWSEVNSCGFLLAKCDKEEIRNVLDKSYLMYCTTENGLFFWTYCRDRVAYSVDPNPNYWDDKETRKVNDAKIRAEYKRELVKLDSIIKTN